MKIKTLTLFGFQIEVWDYGYNQFFYPSFNGNAEFVVSSKGFKQLTKYLRTIIWMRKTMTTLSQ